MLHYWKIKCFHFTYLMTTDWNTANTNICQSACIPSARSLFFHSKFTIPMHAEFWNPTLTHYITPSCAEMLNYVVLSTFHDDLLEIKITSIPKRVVRLAQQHKRHKPCWYQQKQWSPRKLRAKKAKFDETLWGKLGSGGSTAIHAMHVNLTTVTTKLWSTLKIYRKLINIVDRKHYTNSL